VTDVDGVIKLRGRRSRSRALAGVADVRKPPDPVVQVYPLGEAGPPARDRDPWDMDDPTWRPVT